MASGDSFSRVSVARPWKGEHSQAALHRRAHAYPDETKFGDASLGLLLAPRQSPPAHKDLTDPPRNADGVYSGTTRSTSPTLGSIIERLLRDEELAGQPQLGRSSPKPATSYRDTIRSSFERTPPWRGNNRQESNLNLKRPQSRQETQSRLEDRPSLHERSQTTAPTIIACPSPPATGFPARSHCRSKNGANPPSAMVTDMLPGQHMLSFKCSFTFIRISKQALGMNEPFNGHLSSLEDALLVLSDLSDSHVLMGLGSSSFP
ncbi:hypothetical protein CRG98_032620 [Punica granatum]|uniref:Uncharacterized protein n=1 Tax=Punica granatum TaxID=22663 RepID=A0A2I0ISL4_PUNGR|nr:hypothetical protein CRG98_032620 [Punica granatum]